MLTPNILGHVTFFLTAPNIMCFAATNRELYTGVIAENRLRLRTVVGPFCSYNIAEGQEHDFTDAILDMLQNSGSVVSGLRVLCAMTAIGIGAAPMTLEIYTPHAEGEQFKDMFCIETEEEAVVDGILVRTVFKGGYTVSKSTHRGRPHHWIRWGGHAFDATYLQGIEGQPTSGCSIIIIQSTSDLAYAPVFHQPTTALMGFMSPGRMWHMYPRFMWGKDKEDKEGSEPTLSMMHNHGVETLIHGPAKAGSMEPTMEYQQKVLECQGMNIHRGLYSYCLLQHLALGYTLIASSIADVDGDRCKCDKYCYQERRYADKGKVLRHRSMDEDWPMQPHSDGIAFSLGGYRCHNGGDAYAHGFVTIIPGIEHNVRFLYPVRM